MNLVRYPSLSDPSAGPVTFGKPRFLGYLFGDGDRGTGRGHEDEPDVLVSVECCVFRGGYSGKDGSPNTYLVLVRSYTYVWSRGTSQRLCVNTTVQCSVLLWFKNRRLERLPFPFRILN